MQCLLFTNILQFLPNNGFTTHRKPESSSRLNFQLSWRTANTTKTGPKYHPMFSNYSIHLITCQFDYKFRFQTDHKHWNHWVIIIISLVMFLLTAEICIFHSDSSYDTCMLARTTQQSPGTSWGCGSLFWNFRRLTFLFSRLLLLQIEYLVAHSLRQQQ